jgi:predicted TPR repeat methyltransferase
VKIEDLLNTPEAQNMKEQYRFTLGDLYYRVGKKLGEATDEECKQIVKGKKVIMLTSVNSPVKDLVLENAISALRTSLNYRPGYAEVETAMSQLQTRQKAMRASPSIVRQLFDENAETFDRHLAALNYVAPQEVATEVARVAKQRGRLFSSALDAGCGTGLVGTFIRQFVNGFLIGADISEKMLAKARDRRDEKGFPVYDELNAGDVLSLGLIAKTFEIVVSADVLVYFGEFGPILSTFKKLLIPGGTLIFTCERLESSETEWKLEESGRYSHGRKYVEKTALSTGLRLVEYREIVPRMNKGKEVPGHIFVFKADH